MTRALLILVALLALAPAPAAAGEPDATAPAYDVALTGSEGGFRWTGRETIALTNPGLTPLDSVWVRLWGNGADGCRGPRAVRIEVAPGARRGATRARCTAVELRLDAPIAPGARGVVAFSVDIRVPRERDRFGRGGRRMALVSNAIPVIAHREAGAWRLDRWYGTGEAWTYPAADWTVRLDAPPGVSVAAPGVRLPDGTRRLEHGRDYSFAAGRMRSLSETIGGIAVTVWGAAAERAARVRSALAITRRRLPSLVALFGPYGWSDLQVVVTDAAAMEHTALIMTPPRDFVVVHELAHEWWYASVGDDQAADPWLDEAFATYAEEAVRGQRPWCRRSGPGARLVTRSVDFWRRHQPLYGLIYVEGACLLDLIERRMGRAPFRAALRQYAIANRYGWSTNAEFRAAMDAASPVGLGDLWRRYRVQ